MIYQYAYVQYVLLYSEADSLYFCGTKMSVHAFRV